MSYPNGRMPAIERTWLPPRFRALAYYIEMPPGAAAAVARMADAFEADLGVPLEITDGYRSFEAQERVFRQRYRPGASANALGGDHRRGPDGRTWHRVTGAPVAPVGTSNHGTSDPAAVDFASGINRFGSAAHEWMRRNAARFGFAHPWWAREGGPTPEAWHWEWSRSRDPHYGRGVPFWGGMQRALCRHGHVLTVDEHPGPATNTELRIWQEHRGLTPDWTPGPATLAALGIDEYGHPISSGAGTGLASINDTTEELDMTPDELRQIVREEVALSRDKDIKSNDALGRFEREWGPGGEGLREQFATLMAAIDELTTGKDALR